jgi:hypothetical protein
MIVHSNVPREKILLDLSDDPIQEMLLVAVLNEMIRATTAEVQNTSTDRKQGFTASDPEHEPKQAEVALRPQLELPGSRLPPPAS